MKNTTKFILIALVLVFVFQFTSACDYHNNHQYNDLDTNDGVILVIQQVPAGNYNNHEWENKDRYPVYDYRNGYSYRATYEYQKNLQEEVYYNNHYSNYNYGYHDSERSYYQQSPYVYYTYDDYMRRYTQHECYVNPPRDRVFYIKCP